MTVALILLAALVAVGLPLWFFHKPDNEPSQTDAEEQPEAGEECCGMHMSCERDSLIAAVSREVEYFDDEELDRHAGADPAGYSADDIEEFRDILLTLRPEDIAPWARSLQLRGISLPPPVREELIMIVAEERQKRSALRVQR